MTKIVALLPMKANSERVPGKNFREFVDKPLFQWILNSLLAIPEIDVVVINTDARNILAENGLSDSDRVLIRDRRPDICGDHVSMNKILADDIDNVPADIYLMTHTTNPLLSSSSIRYALNEYRRRCAAGDIDSLFTVNKIQTRFYRENGEPINHNPNHLVRTQDLEPWYEENSNLYIFSRKSFTATNARIGQRPGMFVTPKFEALDIDEPEDWDMAVAAARHLRGDS
jgi:CMP-N-acetylneuraminic acid synthetase